MVNKFIEVDFPVKGVSIESVKEKKSSRHGHIANLHQWWARRPLAASRASIYASMIQEPINYDDFTSYSEFIIALSKWDNLSNQSIMKKARMDINQANNGIKPKIIDPFSGGGAIPLEALRLGCEAYANDLNPVAILVEKCALEFPQKYVKNQLDESTIGKKSRDLVEDIYHWSDWVYKRAETSLSDYYQSDIDGSIPVGYFWANTVKCCNPACSVEIPLVKQTWLANKEDDKRAYKLIPNKTHIGIEVKEKGKIDFNPGIGTVLGSKVICPVCGTGLTDKQVRQQFKQGKISQRILIVATYKKGKTGKNFRPAIESDMATFCKAEQKVKSAIHEYEKKWGINPIPNEPTPENKGSGAERAFSLRNYGIEQWGELFNPRQKLSQIVFMDSIKQAYELMLRKNYDPDYARAVTTYLALSLDKIIDSCSIVCRWKPDTIQLIPGLSGRQTISIMWDYFELNPISGISRSWEKTVKEMVNGLNSIDITTGPATITQSSATQLPYPDRYFDAVITDPPYYDNVPYSYLSDFFYVWLKRVIGDLYPELFATPLTPKSQEIVAYSNIEGGFEAGKNFFEMSISQAFREANRILKDDGIACIVFAHKSTEAWETIVNALLESGLYLTASWPLHTEMPNRMRGQDSAALASSIYMVCRKRTSEETAYFNELKPQIEDRIRKKLDQFWSEGIGGSDLFISAIGPSMEVFGKYKHVEKLSGESVTAQELLTFVRKSVSEYALSKILKNPRIGDIDDKTRFYLLWRWTYDSSPIPFDDARLLSQAVGLEIEEHWTNGIVKKTGEQISVLDAKGRGIKFIERGKFDSIIDILQACLLHWEANDKKAIAILLEQSGYTNNNTFWQVAQAISEVLSEGEKEKQMIQGFIYGKDSYEYETEPTKLVKGQKSLEGWN